MASLSAVRTALAATISTVPGLRVSATYVSQVSPPAAVIMPAAGNVVSWDTISGEISYFFRCVLLVPYGDDLSSQTAMDALLDGTQPGSVLTALRDDPTLGHVVGWAIPTALTGYGLLQWAGVDYFGSSLAITVAV